MTMERFANFSDEVTENFSGEVTERRSSVREEEERVGRSGWIVNN